MAPMMIREKLPFSTKRFTSFSSFKTSLPSHLLARRTSATILGVFLAYTLLIRQMPSSTFPSTSFLSSLRPLEQRTASRPFDPSPPERSDLPPSLLKVLPPQEGPVHNFSVPHLTTYYYDTLSNESTKLYLITSGIMMDYSERNISAVGCLVGHDLYPAQLFVSEVVHCMVPRSLVLGERLAPVVAYDDVLQRAEAGPVTLKTGVVAELFPGDIVRLPEKTSLHGDLKDRDLTEFRVARSSHIVGPSDNFEYGQGKFRPRYQICQMTMVAPNSHMINDWANYHRRIGVDMVYIFDNGAALDLQDIYKDRPDIEVISWPYHKSQVEAVTMFLFMARSRCERVFMHDSDEYAMFGLGDGSCLTTGERPMVTYSNKAMKMGYPCVKLMYIVMGNSGFLHRPEGEVPMNYVHRKEKNRFANGKSICHVDSEDWHAGSIHQGGVRKGSKLKTYSENITNWGDIQMRPMEVDDPPFLIHFRERSWEEWIEKWDAGRISGKLVADEKAGSFTMDEPMKRFMATPPELQYKHFREKVYKRVMREGRTDEQIVVQTKNGKRCEMLYKIVGNSVTGPKRERCA